MRKSHGEAPQGNLQKNWNYFALQLAEALQKSIVSYPQFARARALRQACQLVTDPKVVVSKEAANWFAPVSLTTQWDNASRKRNTFSRVVNLPRADSKQSLRVTLVEPHFRQNVERRT